jgi:hypothetical protein
MLDFDREDEKCFFSVDIQGRDAELASSLPREQIIYNRFHPVDVSQRIGAVAVSPDGRTVAMRFATAGSGTPPAIYEVAADRTSLVIPDEAARAEWLNVLIETARALLAAGLPPAVVDGRPADRPTLLPIPGEIPAPPGLPARLSRISRFGSALCQLPRVGAEGPRAAPLGSTSWEDRLFFDYLRGDYPSAAADLEALEPLLSTADERLGLLSLRAQILAWQGERARARAIVDYLIATGGGDFQRVEETPMGLVVTTEANPRQTWARYLSGRIASEGPLSAPPQPVDPLEERIEPPFPNPNPIAPLQPPVDQRGARARGAAAPFAPIPRALEPGASRP